MVCASKKTALAAIFLCIAATSYGQSVQTEIDHLLAFVAQSDCLFIRNDKQYETKAALKHIQRKYRHFRDDIKTAEDFIRLSASESTMTGKAYQVACPNSAPLTSKVWLQQELESFRESKSIVN